MSEHLDPLAYVLLFPAGDPGWTPELQHQQLPEELLSAADQQRYTRISPEQFYRRRLMVFPLDEKVEEQRILPHAGGLLFQQYCWKSEPPAWGSMRCSSIFSSSGKTMRRRR